MMNIIGISGLHNNVPFKKREFPNLSSRRYRIAQGFDSAAALVSSDGIKAAAEERFTGEKQTNSFPANAIRYCLQAANITLDVVDYIGHSFSYEPVRSFYEHSEFTQKQFTEVYLFPRSPTTLPSRAFPANALDCDVRGSIKRNADQTWSANSGRVK